MKSADNICLNCDTRLKDELYCPSCGQKARIKNLSLRYLLSTFYVAFLDFDKKLLRSLRDIWIPNKISENFLSGGRNTYVNHIRFFIVCLATCLALLAIHLKRADMSAIEVLEKTGYQSSLKTKFKEFREKMDPLDCQVAAIDSLGVQLFGKSMQKRTQSEDKEGDETENDSIALQQPTKDTFQILDNTINFSVNRSTSESKEEIQEDSPEEPLEFNDLTTENNFTDIYNISPDSILTKYNVTTPWEQYFVKQGIKTVKNASSAMSFFLSNMLWGILIVTILMAFALKLLYIRHKSFFVEHLMHMINFHCVFLLGLSLLLLIALFTDVSKLFVAILIILSSIYLMVSLKKYYSQGWLKTLFKGVLIFYFYLMSFTLAIAMILFVSFAFL